MSVPSKPYFHDEEAAFAYLESKLWATARCAFTAVASIA
jgi:hypothetical protein